MKDILLTSEEFVKASTNCSDNVNSKLMKTAIREAQEINLKSVIGSNMLRKLKDLVEYGGIEEEEYVAYKELLDECQYFLAYSTLTKLCVILTYGLDNVGLYSKSDEHMETLSVDDTLLLQNHYQKKADWFQMTLQQYILNHKSELPEIGDNKCHEIHANLYSAASGGLWLGGKRSK